MALGVLSLLAWATTAAVAESQPLRWRWCNPRPFGADIFDTAYGFGLTVAVTERGGIFTSEDLVFWQPRDSRTTNALRAITFFGERLVITGERGTVLHADSLSNFQLEDLQTEDWLEGVTASSNLLVSVGDNGAIYTSEDGARWSRQPTSFTHWLSSVVHGQGTFVAVGERGLIVTSENGTNWVKRSSGTSRYFYRVSYVDDQFLAVGESGLFMASGNGGLTWNPISSGATGELFSATGTFESQVVVGDGEVRLRKAALWSNELESTKVLPAPAWTYYNSLWTDGLYLITGRSGMLVEGFQTNVAGPFVWVERTESIRNWLWELKRLPDFYITVGYRGTIMTSVNGVDWSLELPPSSVTNTTLLGVGGTTNLLIAVGGRGAVILSSSVFTNFVTTNLNGTVVTNDANALGVFWDAIPPPTTNDLQGVTVFGDQFVLTGDNGTVLTSSDGTNWVHRDTPTAHFLTGVAAFPGGLVAVGHAGTLLTSPDGITWEDVPSETTNWLYRVRYLGGSLIVVGQNGTILTSPDGVTWTQRASSTTSWLNDVTLLGDTYFVVGTQGTVLTSSNLVNWARLDTITRKSLYGVSNSDGQLVVAGVEGVILRSQMLPDLTPVSFLDFSRREQQNLYLFSGKPNQRFTMERSGDLINWSRGPVFEFLDGTGTLLLFEDSTGNSPPGEFYRATLVP